MCHDSSFSAVLKEIWLFPLLVKTDKKLITVSQPGSWIVFAASNFLPKYVVSLQGDICRHSLQTDRLKCCVAERIRIKNDLHSLWSQTCWIATCQKNPPAPALMLREGCLLDADQKQDSKQQAGLSAEFLIIPGWKVRSWCCLLNARQGKKKQTFLGRHPA